MITSRLGYGVNINHVGEEITAREVLTHIFNFWSFYRQIFIFSYSAKLFRKTQHVWTEHTIFRVSVVPAYIYLNFMSWSTLFFELWGWLVCTSQKSCKKVTIIEVVDFVKISLSSQNKQVKIRLWGEYQPCRWRNNGQGGLNSHFQFLIILPSNFYIFLLHQIIEENSTFMYRTHHYRWSDVPASIY